MNNLLEVFPFIKQTMLDLEKQNKFLNKVTLTGKINALNVASNLFEFTDKTAVVFDELKIELIEALLDENIRKITNELNFKAKTAIDILIRNLFERTADIGFLSTDSLIIDFLTSQDITKESVQNHLLEYVNKYSVYNEIIIFDIKGHALVNLNTNNLIVNTQDKIINEALVSNSYIEQYKKTDIFQTQEKTLIYAQKITHNSKAIGVLCLCFKLEDELTAIFKSLSLNKEILSISDNSSIIATNNTTAKNIKYKYSNSEYSIIDNKYIYVSQKTSGYQGYFGILGWYASAIQSTKNLNNNLHTEESSTSKLSLLSENLSSIIEKANNIIEDIADVIINGELIASKQKVYVLTPILDNMRNISTELLVSIKDSIKNLEHVIQEGYIYDAKMASHLAVDIMDRNLYERANDSRWWAMTPSFIQELSVENPNIQKLNKILQYINELYTVYTNIFIYDKDKKIIAVSKNPSLLGTQIDAHYIERSLQNIDTQKYFVSDFKKEFLYENKPTYIYAASISAQNKTFGGIGVVFDAYPEFNAILEDSFPKSKKGFMVFADREKKIIATTSLDLNILDTLTIDDKFFTITDTHSIYDFITLNDVSYIVASVKSQGYREYKNRDNYTNDIFCLTFIKV